VEVLHAAAAALFGGIGRHAPSLSVPEQEAAVEAVGKGLACGVPAIQLPAALSAGRLLCAALEPPGWAPAAQRLSGVLGHSLRAQEGEAGYLGVCGARLRGRLQLSVATPKGLRDGSPRGTVVVTRSWAAASNTRVSLATRSTLEPCSAVAARMGAAWAAEVGQSPSGVEVLVERHLGPRHVLLAMRACA
jgi:hypothetical protein